MGAAAAVGAAGATVGLLAEAAGAAVGLPLEAVGAAVGLPLEAVGAAVGLLLEAAAAAVGPPLEAAGAELLDADFGTDVADDDGAELEQATADISRAARAKMDSSLELIGEISFGGMIVTGPPEDRRAQLYANSNHSVNGSCHCLRLHHKGKRA